MRPGAILVSIVSLVLSLSAVVWLSNSFSNVDIDDGSGPSSVKKEDGLDVPRPSADEGPQPTADFAETKYDFGTMLHMSKGSHEFTVTNNGDASLELKAGKTTCQCTLGEVGSQELAPGESTTIGLSWEIKSSAAKFEHAAIIHTNAPEHDKGEVRLMVQGDVVFDLETKPSGVLSLGTVSENGSASRPFALFSRYHGEFELRSIDCPNSGMKVDFAPMTEEELSDLERHMESEMVPTGAPGSDMAPVAPKFGYMVTVTADDTVAVGSSETPLTLHTSLEKFPEYSYTVQVRRPAPFEFFPLPGTRFVPDSSRVTCAAFDADKGAEMSLLILATGLEEALEISPVSTDPEWLEAEVTTDTTSSGVRRQRLTIKVPPGAPPGTRGMDNPAAVTLKTNHPKVPELKLKVTFLSK